MSSDLPEEPAGTQKNRASQTRFAKQWHYRPTVPLATSPFFQMPVNLKQCGRWVRDRWFVLGENVLLLLLAVITWNFFQPGLDKTHTLELGWVGMMFLRNVLLIVLVAGGLHYLLFYRRFQGKKLRFDAREMKASGANYTFKNQLFDNVFWTLGSGVIFWTAYEVLMLWAMANNVIPVMPWLKHPILFVLWLVLTPVWISLHFYWIHRFLHWPPMYKIVHSLHHRNTNIGPWSGLSMHPIEHLLFFSSVLIHWVVMAHPIHILFHLQHQALTAATSHAGFDALVIKDKSRLSLGNFHHQMHHRYFECNYGSLEMPWDKLFGSFHDGTDESHSQFTAKRRKRLT